MTRLYDRLLDRPHDVVFGPDAAFSGDGMTAMRTEAFWGGATVIDASAPARMFLLTEKHLWGPADFPTLAPAFDTMFIEVPATLKMSSDVVVEWWGVYYVASATHYGWECGIMVLCEVGNKFVPVLNDTLHLDRNGAILGDLNQWGFWSAYNPDSDMRPIVDMGMLVLGAAFFAVSLMHCKNITYHAVEPPKLSPHLKRKRRRPLVRYHVLDIDPMRRVLKTEGRSDEVGLKRALHICRGHFRTYTEEAPMFGRVTGTFWVPQHIRGNAESGVVVKDYNVKAPKARNGAA